MRFNIGFNIGLNIGFNIGVQYWVNIGFNIRDQYWVQYKVQCWVSILRFNVGLGSLLAPPITVAKSGKCMVFLRFNICMLLLLFLVD